MGLRSLSNNNWVYRVVLVTWMISALLIIFLLNNIDSIVHGDLYNYGLQMNTEWANPYWTYLRLNYVLLGVPMVLSLCAIAISFIRKNERVVESVAKPQPKPQRVVCKEQKPKEISSSSSDNGNAVLREDGTMLISCPNCKKVFSRPLVMLNFEGGKTKLVNVCPYCNHVLGNAENEQTSKSEFQIADEDKKLTH
jgi:uncharacterized Zn-finger protein